MAGTRGSKLALIQCSTVVKALTSSIPDLEVEQMVIKTSGDSDQSTPIHEMEGEGAFEKELDAAVLNGQVDFAVHSMKDVPVLLPEGLIIAAVPERASRSDVIVSKGSLKLNELPAGAVIGTGSVLRHAELKLHKRDAMLKDIRGNVDTRLSKLDGGEYDAIIVASAALERMGLKDRIAETLNTSDFMPAAGQGAIALITRKDNSEVVAILRRINSEVSMTEALAERTAISVIGGGCKVPVGAIASVSGDMIEISCVVFSKYGDLIKRSARGSASAAESVAKSLGSEMLSAGAESMLKEWQASAGIRL
jgi:hydroxymethylbilane synthase